MCAGLGLPDIGPFATQRGASAGSGAGGSAASLAACGGREVAIFSTSVRNRHVRTPGRAARLQGWHSSTSGCALCDMERAPAVDRAAAGLGRPLPPTPKSRFSRCRVSGAVWGESAILGLSSVLPHTTESLEYVRVRLDRLRINAGFSCRSLHLTSQPLFGKDGAPLQETVATPPTKASNKNERASSASTAVGEKQKKRPRAGLSFEDSS